jgi:hypothetical protein
MYKYKYIVWSLITYYHQHCNVKDSTTHQILVLFLVLMLISVPSHLTRFELTNPHFRLEHISGSSSDEMTMNTVMIHTWKLKLKNATFHEVS